MNPAPAKVDPRRPRPARPLDRRRIGRATALWGAVSLGSLALLAALIVWHLVRRGRLLIARQPPPRPVRWPAAPEEPDTTS